MALKFNADLTNSGFQDTTAAAWNSYPFTVSGWFYPDENTGGQNSYMLSLTSGAATWWIFGIEHQGGARFFTRVSSQGNATTVNNYRANAWNHYLAIARSSTDREVILNGDYANKGTTAFPLTPGTVNRTTIGFLGDTSPGNPWSGRIDHLCAWNVILSHSDQVRLIKGEDPINVTPNRIIFCPDMSRWHDPILFRKPPAVALNLASLGTDDIQNRQDPLMVRKSLLPRRFPAEAAAPVEGDGSNIIFF